jgi:asparagine synthase (glutamine-hydrolysing)
VLRGFQKWGEDILLKLNGMFAFAIWNDTTKQLFIARDRLGEKPLYYYSDSNIFIFSSEVEPILMSGLIKSELCIEAFEHQLFATSFLETHTDRTLLKNIYSIPPGYKINI